MTAIGDLFLLIGTAFLVLAGLGLVRMPDLFNRIQTGTKATTLGALSVLIGVFFYEPGWWAKLLVLAVFIMITSPIGSSILARAALSVGQSVWHRGNQGDPRS